MRPLTIATLAIIALIPGTASAAVTATSELSSTGISVSVTGDAASDEITVSCGIDANVKVNGLDTADPAACSEVTSLTVDGGAGDDRIDLSAVDPPAFGEVCGPCPRGAYSIVAECISGAGDDAVIASSVGSLIGGCQGMRSMTGDDYVDGGAGDDAIAAGPGEDQVLAGGGDDQLFGGPDDDGLSGGPGDDLVVGKQGDDALFGISGDDRLAGGPGFDEMRGGGGVDSCVGGPGGGMALNCESTRGVSRSIALGFAPR